MKPSSTNFQLKKINKLAEPDLSAKIGGSRRVSWYENFKTSRLT
jgi:hypothetical protein